MRLGKVVIKTLIGVMCAYLTTASLSANVSGEVLQDYSKMFERFDSWFAYPYKSEDLAIADLKDVSKYMGQCAWVSCKHKGSFSLAVFAGEKEPPKSCRKAFSKRADAYASLKKSSTNIITDKINSYVYKIEKYNDDICD